MQKAMVNEDAIITFGYEQVVLKKGTKINFIKLMPFGFHYVELTKGKYKGIKFRLGSYLIDFQ